MADPQASQKKASLSTIFVVLLFAAELLFVSRVCLVYRPHIEGGLIPLGADLIVNGFSLYRDMFTVMWPGSFLLLAFFYKLFGTSWMVTRLVLTVSVFLTGVASFAILRRRCSLWSSLMPSILVCFVALPAWSINYHHWDATLFVTLFLLCAEKLDGLQYRSTAWLILAGVCGGMAFSCYQPLLGCMTIAIVVIAWSCWKTTGDNRLAIRNALLMVALTAAFVGANLSYAAANNAWIPFVEDTILFPLHGYSKINTVPYAANNFLTGITAATSGAILVLSRILLLLTAVPWLVVLAAPLVAIGALVTLAHRAKNDVSQPVQTGRYFALLLGIVGLTAWFVALHRPEIQRLFWGSFPLVILLFMMADRVPRWRQVLLFATTSGAVLYAMGILAIVVNPPYLIHSRRGDVPSIDPLSVIGAVESVTNPGDKVLVYPYDTAINFLSKTRFPSIHPWLQYQYNTAAHIQDAIADMGRSDVKYVVWDTKYSNDTFANLGWPGYVPLPADQLIMEPFLQKNYREIGQYGQYRLLRKLN